MKDKEGFIFIPPFRSREIQGTSWGGKEKKETDNNNGGKIKSR